LILSGGGVSSVFFALGAIGELVDNGKFYDYDVISGVSGGTIVMHFIELCYKYNVVGKKDWFRKYVRNPVYNLFTEGILIDTILMNIPKIFTDYECYLSKLNDILVPDTFPEHSKHRKNIYKKRPVFLFRATRILHLFSLKTPIL
jgi:hypothetical protein